MEWLGWMRFGFLVLAACMVLVLGCPQPGSIGGVMDGVRINSFGFDSSTISDKEEVELSLEIENVGAYDTDAKFYVYGYDDGVWALSPDGSSSGGVSWSADGLRGCMMDAKTAGMTANRYQIFKVKPDSVSKGITERYTFSGRLCYKYETRANGMIKAISASQRRDEKKKGAFSQSTVSLQNSYAPVRVELKTKSPVVFYKSGSEQVADLALVIRNAAGGYPAKSGCSNGVDVAGINKLSGLSVSLDGDDLDCDDDLSLYDGEAVVYCSYSVTSSQPRGEYMLSVVADYYYYVDRSASISVSGSSDEVVSAGAPGGGGSSGTSGTTGEEPEDSHEEEEPKEEEEEPASIYDKWRSQRGKCVEFKTCQECVECVLTTCYWCHLPIGETSYCYSLYDDNPSCGGIPNALLCPDLVQEGEGRLEDLKLSPRNFFVYGVYPPDDVSVYRFVECLGKEVMIENVRTSHKIIVPIGDKHSWNEGDIHCELIVESCSKKVVAGTADVLTATMVGYYSYAPDGGNQGPVSLRVYDGVIHPPIDYEKILGFHEKYAN